MRRTARIGMAAITTAAVLTGTATAQAAGLAAQDGARPSGHPVNVFGQAGYSNKAVNAKIEAAWDQLFHGAPGTAPDYYDGQSIYYQVAPDKAYVTDVANHDVRTEGMGYAMMIAVQLGKKTEFDSLWNFAKTNMQLQSGPTKSFFAWHTRTDGTIIDRGIAPDGDQWIAAALTFAAGRWGNGSGIYSYGSEARQILHAMWHNADSGGVNMYDAKTYLPTFSPPGVTNFSDASYALPAFYRVFAKADPADKQQWDNAVTAGEKLLQTAHNPTTGLSPCYSNFDGSPHLAPWESPTNPETYSITFQEDAWRVIANANLDASWWGVQPWQTQFSNTLEDFFVGQGVSTYVSRYQLDGTPLKGGQNTYEPAHAEGLVAMNSTSAITATGDQRLDFVRDFWNTPVPSGRARYYDGMLYLLGLLYDSGQFRMYGTGAAVRG
ncbi:oligosaccharide reducing-end xylanase [Motilibacter rhizosphaerae]|uniref:Oligosaccharide reducing-end xylanase n=1 Tax=Motilibacter rhizosphaerae TaxID=598652 RepID=A0A4Q7NBE4_9ACTN|nr:glycosyl hydrolase family 8 [Motilibacter rhizosphaerae]RZS79937.1 oligosaccharide reducing-end xylanase [Motilibacter rhizosphaerae]